MSLKVIGAGFGRTGTLSLHSALEELGFTRCYHMREVLTHPDHVAAWSAASRGEPVDWDALFAGYQATVDWPACSFYRELLNRYPDAKVILTVRDADKWYDSAFETIYYVRQAFPMWSRWFLLRMRRFTRMLDDVVWLGTFQGRFADKQHAIAAFNRHNDEVRRTVPADRLLIYEVSRGWEPLCAFLGVPVPQDKPFPRLNDTAEFRSRIRKAVAIVWGVSCAAVILIVLGLIWLASKFIGV
ncbi:MAG TPA: sulfotransferase [Gemmataceae bacterium]|nr:sulfotransferase [Gemmataceae bacterium]